MRNEDLLQEWFIDARLQLAEIGFPIAATNVPIKLNGRLERCLGRSFYDEKIEINEQYFLYETNEQSIKNTIMHELCHQLIYEEDYHGKRWWDVVKYVNTHLGYDMKEVADSNLLDWKLNSPKYVTCICDKCGKQIRPFKLVNKNNLPNYSHKNCGGKLKIKE